MFHHSRNVQINGGTFNSEYHGPVHLSNHKTCEWTLASTCRRITRLGLNLLISEGMEVLLNAASPSAFHNSGERFDPPKCYPNTRVAVLSKIMDWIIGAFGWDQYIMWLYGPAGAGKSAIAQTIAEMCNENHSLLASFFFARSDPKRNSVKPLAASIAYQVAVNIPRARSLIESVVANDPAIFQRSFRFQFNALIVEPLMQVYKMWSSPVPLPYLVIIDGLDECNDANGQRHILDTISDALSLSKNCIHLMVLFSSRTEREISLAFATRTLKRVTSHIALDDTYQAESDIRQYFYGHFYQIKQTHLQKRSIPTAWPTDADISLLVAKSSGQFIYAATVVRYISSSQYNPIKNLEIILGLHPTRTDMPFAELDALYSDILSRVEDINATLRLLGGIILSHSNDKSTGFLEGLMLLEEGDATRLLADLSSIIMIDEKSNIRVLHASLGDFLFDQARSNKYHINPVAMITDLSYVGLHHISQFTIDYIWFAYWWFEEAKDFLFRAYPTNELREMVCKTPVVQCIYSMADTLGVYERLCDKFTGRFLLGLKTSEFSNTNELYLYHRGVWDKILHERLSNIDSDTMVNAIIASAFVNRYFKTLADVLATIFKIQPFIPPTRDDCGWIKTTLYNYIGPYMDPGYRELLLEFLVDPIRAGKYVMDGTKFATLTKILLEFLIQSRKNKHHIRLIARNAYEILGIVEELIPQAGPSSELIEMLNNSAIILPYECCTRGHIKVTRNFQSTVRTFANYLTRVCGSLPPGFRITVKRKTFKGEDISYYYNADDE